MSRFFSAAGLTVVSLLMISLSGCAEPEIPQGYALVYGVADYSAQNTGGGLDLPPLTATDNDARDTAAMLSSRGWQTYLRIDDGSEPGTGPATLSQLETDIAALSALISPEDRVLFYYSGHGGSVSSLSSGVPSHEPAGDESYDEWIFLYSAQDYITGGVWLDNTVNDDTLGTLLGSLPNKIKMVILDACNSGGFIGTEATVDALPRDYRATDIFTPPLSSVIRAWTSYPDTTQADILTSEAIVLAAAGELELSYETGENGVFTSFLLQTPSQGDLNSDGWITISEAAQYATDRLQQTWNAYYGEDFSYLPHISGTPLDYVLFPAD